MKLHFGPIPENTRFHPEARGWRPLPHDHPRRFMALALPTAFLLFLAFVAVSELVDLGGLGDKPPFISRFLILFVGSVVAHELIHMIAHPGWGRSRRSFLGFWPRYGVFYAHYDGHMSRNRLLLVILLPFGLLAVLPFAVCAVSGLASPWATWMSALNAALAGGDVVFAIRLLRYVPRSAVLRNRGWYTWWRADPETMARHPVPAREEKPKGLRRLAGPARWAGAIVILLAAHILVFGPFFGGHECAKNDLRMPTRVFEPGHGYHPVGTVGEGGVVRLWKGAPDWVEGWLGPSRAIWRAGYRFQMWKRGLTIVLVDERPEMVGHPDFLKNWYSRRNREEETLDEDIVNPDEPEPDEQ